MANDMTPFPTSRGPKGTDFAAYADHFSAPEITTKIADAIAATREWLQTNEGSIDAYGILNARLPWFTEGVFTTVPMHEMAYSERLNTVEAKVYGHGIAMLAYNLYDADVVYLDVDDLSSLVLMRSGEVKEWMRILVRYSWVDDSMSLKEFKETGDYRPDTVASHARKKLNALAALGLVTVEIQPGRSKYKITAGPVAKAFFEEIWHPVSEEFKAKITPLEKKL